MNRLIDFLTIIAWNIYIGSGVKEAREALKQFAKDHQPELICLMEATNLYDDLNGLGYEVVQLKPRALRPGNRPGQANTAILVRKDLEIRKRAALHMGIFWTGPKHGWEQDPRVYRWVLVRRPGEKRWWKVGVAHVPFGEAARSETVRRLVKWFKATIPGRATILVLDANMKLAEFKKKIADPAGAEASGPKIDLEAHKNCELVSSANMGRGISDHPAWRYNFVAKRKRRNP